MTDLELKSLNTKLDTVLEALQTLTYEFGLLRAAVKENSYEITGLQAAVVRLKRDNNGDGRAIALPAIEGAD